MRGEGQGPFGTFPKIHLFWRRHPSLSHGWTVEMITYQVLLLYSPPPAPAAIESYPKPRIAQSYLARLVLSIHFVNHSIMQSSTLHQRQLVEWQSKALLYVLSTKYTPGPPASRIYPSAQIRTRGTNLCQNWWLRELHWTELLFPRRNLVSRETVIYFVLIFALDHQMTIRCQLTSSQSNFFWKLVCQISFQRILFLLIKSLLWIDWRRSMLRTLLSKIT